MKKQASDIQISRFNTLFILLLLPCLSYAQNNLCGAAPVLTSVPTCTATVAGSLPAAAGYTAIPGGTGCSGSTNDDVWYTFIANSTGPTITITGSTIPATRIQVFSGSCAAMTSIACGNTAVTPVTVVGTQYWIRIYSNSNGSGTFSNICIVDPAPANDNCAAAAPLTSSLSCVNIPGNFYASTTSATPAAPCAGPVVYDLWYTFTAATDNATITLSGIGSGINSPHLQLFSGTCAALVSIACGTTAIAASSLVPGTTYFVRAYASGGVAPTSAATGGFNICVTHAPPPPPSNDECTGAIALPLGGGCGNILGTVISATASATPVAPCTGPVTYDVWYSFTAVNTTANITLGSFGAGFTAARRLQLFSGTCGSLTSLFCGTTTIAATGLTAGNTYYIRVYSSGGVAAPITNGDFTICVSTTSPPPRFGNSYVNITKQTVGGVVEKGDILEIRMTISHTSGTLFRARYLDSIPTNTVMLSSAADSIRVITNEGDTYRRYTATPNVNDDAATYKPTPAVGEYQIRMNLGFLSGPPGAPANNTIMDLTGATGTIVAGSDHPTGYGGVLFASSFRVRVTGNPGDTIKLATGKFIYRTALAGADITLSAIPFKILISTPMGLCNNAIGTNNAQEFGGTFGSGGTLNRPTDLTYPIPTYTFIDVAAANQLADGQYAIVKNISPRNSTNRLANRQNACGSPPPAFDCNNRMWGGFWDIDGDHTGTNNAIGNVPPAASDTAGYMLEVNTDYVTTEIYKQTLTGLCPSTFYEFSAWVRNICKNCAIDTGGSRTYQPGVLPNLAFALDGIDRYSTGEMDTIGWVKKGFVFLTGPAQTSTVFTIRNNSQGGGGNDWVLDDIVAATCLPSMKYSPSANPSVCVLNASTVYDTVSSFFNNYVYYKWQRSTDGGVTWIDIMGPQGPVTPVLVNGLYVYFTHYVIPPAMAALANNGDKYRVVAATSVSNLSSTNCIVTNGVNFLTLNVLNCGTPLKTDILSLNGKLAGDMANLSWSTTKEEEPIKYEVERSTDGNIFTLAGIVNSYNSNTSESQYTFIDPVPVTGKVYYRIVIASQTGNKKYSRTITLALQEGNKFALVNMINPFSQVLVFDIHSPVDTRIDAELLDILGRTMKRKVFIIHSGVSQLSMIDTKTLPAGTYILRVRNNDQVLTRKVLRSDQ